MRTETASANRDYFRTYRQMVKADPVRLAKKRRLDALAAKRYRLRKKLQAADGGLPLTTEQFIARVISQANLGVHDDRGGVAPASDAHGLTEA